ncbi:uroporphyrinogen-III synthase-like [Oppia nitens]|uniref:uroporphyrinogen-III synthase-like n=1 Tax=Oppia nitens TaxID=1686743 RepID=UPI0023D97B90|nr:uroporphyrinogen-III synthase-like [Oppia nitens]
MDPISQLSSPVTSITPSPVTTKSDISSDDQSKVMDTIVVLMTSNDTIDDYTDEIQSKCSTNTMTFRQLSPISFTFINTKRLYDSLLASDQWSALCLTSKRCVDAIEMAINYSKDSGIDVIDLWRRHHKLVFIVGLKSFYYLKAKLGLEALGSDAGNGENLAKMMIENHRHELTALPVLFPCSQSRSDILPKLLTSAGIDVHEIPIYETHTNQGLDTKVAQLSNDLISLSNQLSDEMKLRLIVIFFSPSGLKSVYPFLIQYIINNKTLLQSLTLRYVAIGGTTGQSMKQLGLNVWFTSPKPNPQSLAHSLNEYLLIDSNRSEIGITVKVRELDQQKHEDLDE